MTDWNSGVLTTEDKQRLIELDKILERDSFNIPALQEKGFILHDGCFDEEAIEVFKQILKIDDKNLDAYIWLCESVWMLGDYKQLKEVAENALKIYPNKAVFYKFLAYAIKVVYYLDPEKIKALYAPYLRKSIELEPDWLSTRIALIAYLIEIGKFEEAKKETQEALKQIQDDFPIPKNDMQYHYEELITRRLGAEDSRETLNNFLKKIDENEKSS
jgi:tetratricopeptide (TPR) repeat protein